MQHEDPMNSHWQSSSAPRSPALPQWQRSSESWSEHAELIATMTRDATDALLHTLEPRAGQRVLDIACGPGDPSLRLSQSVGPAGTVVSIDPISTMIRRTQQRARDGALSLAAVQSRGEHLPFGPGSFDGVCCRFGIMFFSDPAGALVDVRRVLRPGGRAVFAVWGPRDHNAYFTATVGVLDELGHLAPESSADAPTPFQFAESDALALLMREAGFESVRQEQCAIKMRLSGYGPRDFFDVQRALSPSIGERVAALADEQLEVIRTAVARIVQPWSTDGGLALPGEIYMVSGIAGAAG